MILELIKEIEMKTFEIPIEVGKIDATLSLIQVAADYCEADVTTSLMIKVESESENVGNLVKYIGSLEKAGPTLVKREPTVIIKKRTRIQISEAAAAVENEKTRKAATILNKVDPLSPWPDPPPPADPELKIIGYCRGCTGPVFEGARSRYCSSACGNRYSVTRCNLDKKGVNLDAMLMVKVGEKVRKYTEDQFNEMLRLGEIPEGTRAVTPKGTLKVVVFQGGRLTTNEYFPSEPEVQ
jgi:hypothetical protein